VPFDDARRVIEDARANGLFPAATTEIGSSAGPIWSQAFATALSTPFDLASLTKVIATTTVVMELVRQGALQLDEPMSAFFAEWRGTDRKSVTVRDLLEHAAGSNMRSARSLSNTRPGHARYTAISGSSCSGFSPPIAVARRWTGCSI
jgi:hypothetical protein